MKLLKLIHKYSKGKGRTPYLYPKLPKLQSNLTQFISIYGHHRLRWHSDGLKMISYEFDKPYRMILTFNSIDCVGAHVNEKMNLQ